MNEYETEAMAATWGRAAAAMIAAWGHAIDHAHYVVINADGARRIISWECQECGERGASDS